MEEIVGELNDVLQQENDLWKDFYFSLTWKIFQNKNNINVIVKMLDTNVLQETISNSEDVKVKVADYLKWLREN